jgi:polyisoprenoid-binding protein YceI
MLRAAAFRCRPLARGAARARLEEDSMSVRTRSRFVAPAVIVLALAGTALAAAETFQVDPDHAAVTFKIKHLGTSYTHGRFDAIAGTFVLDDANPTASHLELTIQSTSVDTNNQRRDDHLRGPDFFDVRQFPTITFHSTAMRKTADGVFEVTGDLTLHGVTKSITTTVHKVGAGQDPWGKYRAGGELQLTIKRSDYGMTFMADAIGDEVALDISIEGIRQ